MNLVLASSSGVNFGHIPRILHQTWKTGDIPEHWKGFRQSWLDHHPGWQHRFWTDRDIQRLVEQEYSAFRAVFRAFPRDIQRVDAAKILILKMYGGVYADLDTECLRSVDSLLQDGGMLLSRTSDGVIEGAFMASPPGHAFCDQVQQRMGSQRLSARIFMRIPGLQATGVLLSTGPLMLYREQRTYRLASASEHADGLRVLDPRYCSARSWWRRHAAFRPGPETYVIHHHSDSWLLPLERAVVQFARPTGLLLTMLSGLLLLFGLLWTLDGQ